MLKAVFFDVGGTLLDLESLNRSFRFINEQVRRRYAARTTIRDSFFGSVMLQRKDYDYLHRPVAINERPDWASWLFEAGGGEKLGREDLAWFESMVQETHRKHLKLLPHARQLLDGLRRRRYHVGLISNVGHDRIPSMAKILGIAPFLTSTTYSIDLGVRKPEPEIFLAALKKANCSPSEAVMVGDTLESDIRGASALHMKTILIGSISAEADFCAKNLSSVNLFIADLASQQS